MVSNVNTLVYKIAGVVILYKPNSDLFHNINSYLSSVVKIFIIDNSPSKSQSIISLVEKYGDKIYYVFNNDNIGISKALNIAVNLAASESFDWLLTMDQDSSFNSSECQKFINTIYSIRNISTVSIISPLHSDKNKSNSKILDYDEVITTMTSGNLLNIKICKSIGGFDNKLFIDFVDHEYCLRSILSGYKIILIKNYVLNHYLGDTKKHKFFIRSFDATHHNSLRRYYITRNRLYVIKKYWKEFPHFCKEEVLKSVKEFIKIILFENSKLKKIQYIFLGIKDFYFENYIRFNSI